MENQEFPYYKLLLVGREKKETETLVFWKDLFFQTSVNPKEYRCKVYLTLYLTSQDYIFLSWN